MAEVEFFFYLGCPWTYLAFVRLRESATRTGARIAWKPVSIERLRAGSGQPPASHAVPAGARARYQAKDLADWARFCGIVIRHRGPFPLPASAAMGGAVWAIGAGVPVPYCEAIFQAGFAEGTDLGSVDDVVRVAGGAGLDTTGLRQACASAASTSALAGFSDELLARGGFGSPTMFVGDDMYFGNDRMPLVELALSRAGERQLVVPGAHGQF